MQLELVAFTIRKVVEGQSQAKFNATYAPKDSKCFAPTCGSDYHKFIVFTQHISNVQIQGQDVPLYLYYRNKRTANGELPEFSSCECGFFSGGHFVSLFKEHIAIADDNVLTDAGFAKLVAQNVLDIINNGGK